MKQEEDKWLNLYGEVTQTQAQINLLEQLLHPIQEQVNIIRNHLQSLEQLTQKFGHGFHQLQSMF